MPGFLNQVESLADVRPAFVDDGLRDAQLVPEDRVHGLVGDPRRDGDLLHGDRTVGPLRQQTPAGFHDPVMCQPSLLLAQGRVV